MRKPRQEDVVYNRSFYAVLGLYNDGLSAVRYIRSRKDLDPMKVVVYGRSLGGAIAIQVASQSECSDLLAVIIENSFSSLPDIAKKVLNFSLIKVCFVCIYVSIYDHLSRNVYRD